MHLGLRGNADCQDLGRSCVKRSCGIRPSSVADERTLAEVSIGDELWRKIQALAADERRVKDWQDALARDWMADSGDTVATLSVDGHVKVYAGRNKGRLPKHFVSRQKLCLPPSTNCWVNALGGRPLLCLHKDLDPGMARALEHDVLPALERIGLPGPDAPDLTASGDAAPALTLKRMPSLGTWK